MQVKDVMTTPAVEVQETETVQRAAELMAGHGVGLLVVVDGEHRMQGVVTDRDLLLRCVAVGMDPRNVSVGECASGREATGGQLITVTPDADLEDAVETMRRTGVHRIPVTEDGAHVLGMLSLDEVATSVKKYLDAFLAVSGRYHKQSSTA